jgi:hypothetical protein
VGLKDISDILAQYLANHPYLTIAIDNLKDRKA